MDELHDLYTNSASVTASVYEISILFSLSDPEVGITKPVVRVRMSPQHARALKLLLDRFLEGYEETFQKIYLPPEMENRLTKGKVELEEIIPKDSSLEIDFDEQDEDTGNAT